MIEEEYIYIYIHIYVCVCVLEHVAESVAARLLVITWLVPALSKASIACSRPNPISASLDIESDIMSLGWQK